MSDENREALLEEMLQLICIKCRSNPWGPDTPRKWILNNLHDIASHALAGNYEKARQLAQYGDQ